MHTHVGIGTCPCKCAELATLDFGVWGTTGFHSVPHAIEHLHETAGRDYLESGVRLYLSVSSDLGAGDTEIL